MTSLRKEDSYEDSHDGPVEQQDQSFAAENDDSGEGMGKWTSSDDIFSIPEAIEIDDRVRSQMEKPDSPKLAELPPKKEGVELEKEGVELEKEGAELEKEGAELEKEEQLKQPLDLSRIVSSEEYNKGKTHAVPLSHGTKISGGRDPQRKKFLQGTLSRLVERGVVHPLPARLVLSAILLLLSKFFLMALVIIFFVLALTGNIRLVTELIPFFLAFIPFGLGFLIVASRARCRVCSCPLFHVRLCRKHQAAHYVPLLGIACSTALHLLFFKWMRCMYCGTAIRLRNRKPSVSSPPETKDANSRSVDG